MARKVFIAVLGTGFYGACRYQKGDFISSETRFIQQATLEYLNNQHCLDENEEKGKGKTEHFERLGLILLTKDARKKNWVEDNDNIKKDPSYKGLKEVLDGMDLKFPIKPIDIKNGNNEEEIWEIFNTLFNELEPEDQLFFDLTHGFRYLPMLVLVLGNYAKFLKGVTVRHISYGNYEAMDRTTMIAPLMDILPLTILQDWTYAAADYLRNGKSDRFVELAKDYKVSIFQGTRTGDKTNARLIESLAKNLKLTTEDFQTCRGPEILNGKHVSNLKRDLGGLKDISIKPLEPLTKKLEDAFNSFDSTEEKSNDLQFWNGFEAAKWCWDHQLYQQAAVILQENVVSFLCHRNQLDMYDKDQRSLVNVAFKYMPDLNNKDLSEEKKNEITNYTKKNPALKSLLADSLINEKVLYDAFGCISTERNDINHNGMRKSPHGADVIRDNIKNAIDVFYDYFKANNIKR